MFDLHGDGARNRTVRELYCERCRRLVKSASGTGFSRGNAQPKCPKCNGYLYDAIAEPTKPCPPMTVQRLGTELGVSAEEVIQLATQLELERAETWTAASVIKHGAAETIRHAYRKGEPPAQ